MPEPLTLVGVLVGIIVLLLTLAGRYFHVGKELVDIVLGCILLVVLSPVLLICALIVRLSSRGPVIYTQIRAGRNGRLFKMYKFRSMYVTSETGTGAVWAKKGDPRVVPTCRWMRKSHMDELPQLINVIKGEMSLVGPRPERPEILAQLEKVYPDIRKRLAVKPGITGLAQVTQGYDTNIENVRKKLKADLEYIEKSRWSLELSILAKTFSKLRDKQAH